jgi:hypothetical protein
MDQLIFMLNFAKTVSLFTMNDEDALEFVPIEIRGLFLKNTRQKKTIPTFPQRSFDFSLSKVFFKKFNYTKFVNIPFGKMI